MLRFVLVESLVVWVQLGEWSLLIPETVHEWQWQYLFDYLADRSLLHLLQLRSSMDTHSCLLTRQNIQNEGSLTRQIMGQTKWPDPP